MHPVLNRNLFFVKEHAGMFKASNSYDVLDPSNQQIILQCREERLGFFTKMLRFTRYKKMTPFEVIIRTPEGQPVLCVKRGVNLFLSKVDVLDENGQRIGGFKQKMFSLGGAFQVLGANDEPLCDLKGKILGWDFTFIANGQELGKVSKKWAGLGRELFTSADNYMLSISEAVPPDHTVRQMIVAAVMCIDLVLNE
jgi:uncharacterized protein YxjI